MKTAKQMERHLKGMANHYRIEILFCVGERDGITLEDIIETLDANGKTIGEHTRRLFHAGLISKNIEANLWNIPYRLTEEHSFSF